MMKKPVSIALNHACCNLSTLASHLSSFIFVENLQPWRKSHKLYICFDKLAGGKKTKKNPTHMTSPYVITH